MPPSLWLPVPARAPRTVRDAPADTVRSRPLPVSRGSVSFSSCPAGISAAAFSARVMRNLPSAGRKSPMVTAPAVRCRTLSAPPMYVWPRNSRLPPASTRRVPWDWRAAAASSSRRTRLPFPAMVSTTPEGILTKGSPSPP